MSPEEIFLFIEIIQSEEMLWNTSHPNYKNSVGKNTKWNEIGSKFNLTGRDAYHAFRNLREKYRREKNKLDESIRNGSTAPKKNSWIFLNHLSFLDTCYKKRKVSSSNVWKANNLISASSSSTSLLSSSQLQLSPLMIKTEDLPSQPSSPVSSQSQIPLLTLQQPVLPLPHTSSQLRRETVSNNQTQALESILNKNTDNLINVIKDMGVYKPRPYEHVVQFVRATLIDIGEEKAKKLEKELMELLFKYKYN